MAFLSISKINFKLFVDNNNLVHKLENVSYLHDLLSIRLFYTFLGVNRSHKPMSELIYQKSCKVCRQHKHLIICIVLSKIMLQFAYINISITGNKLTPEK